MKQTLSLRPCGSSLVLREPSNDAPYRILKDVRFGAEVVVFPFTNLYGCEIGDSTRVGPFVEIQRGVVVGRRCRIQSHSFICDGVKIGDDVFVGHGVMFINDNRPKLRREGSSLVPEWELNRTEICDRAS